MSNNLFYFAYISVFCVLSYGDPGMERSVYKQWEPNDLVDSTGTCKVQFAVLQADT